MPSAPTATALLNASRTVTERLRTYPSEALNELLEDAAASRQAPLQASTSETSPSVGSPPVQPLRALDKGLRDRAAAQRAAVESEMRAKEAQFVAMLQRRQQESQRRRDESFQSMYQDVLQGLSNENGIMGETQFTLDHSAKIKANKTQHLYEEWSTEVFDKIQDRLQRRVDARSPHSIEHRLKQQMDQYLHTTNTKLGVFRDVIIEEDYDPLAVHAATIKIPIGDIRDPVKRDVLKPQIEKRMMGLATGSSDTAGKFTLDTRMWGELNIHATPYGHCVDRAGNYIVRPLSGGAMALRKSRIPMDHYNYPTGDEAVAAELPRGKLIVPGPEKLRGRKDLFEVMQNNCKPEDTGGDRWMEYKGKQMPPGPEVRRGRKDLHEVVQQSSNPYKDGRTLGDQWLEAKGKLVLPGPEVKAGRPDLFETFQQTSNPYSDGRPLGDRWLVAKGKRPISVPDNDVRKVLMAGRPHTPEPPPVVDNRRSVSHLVPLMGQLTAVE